MSYKTYEREKKNYFQVPEGETMEFEVITAEIIAPQQEDYSPTIKVRHDNEEKFLSLPTVLNATLKEMIDNGAVKDGTKIKVENLGRPKKKKYFDFAVAYQ